MKKETKLKMAAAHQHCEVMDKSTEYTMQFIQDTCNVSLIEYTLKNLIK